MSNSSSGKTLYGWARRKSSGTPVARRFGPVTAIRNAVSLSSLPRPRIRRTKISFWFRSPRLFSIWFVARLIQSPRRLMNSWLMSPFTPPMRR